MSVATVTHDLIVAQTRVLKLPGVARTFDSLARQARNAHWPHEDYLHEVLSAEQASRHESVIRQRLREARFPEVKTLDTLISPRPRASAPPRSMPSRGASG
jgi:DNA replication protein DnaC